jgi:hypothetical protein
MNNSVATKKLEVTAGFVPCRQRDDQIAMNERRPVAVKIRPPFAPLANAVTERSISAAPCMLTGITSTRTDGAIDWIEGPLADPARYGGIPNDCHSRHIWLPFEQL